MISKTSSDSPARGRAAVSQVRSLEINGPAGRLEAILNEGAEDAPFAALVCHPHPLGGGTLHNKVVFHAMKVMNAPQWGLEWPVLRFNFRGTGLSQGLHDGVAEAGDVLAALDWLENAYKLPLVVVGFSFGAAMSLAACCGHVRPGIRAIAALGLPVQTEGRGYDYTHLADCNIPKLFLSGDRDRFATGADLEQIAAHASGRTKLVVVTGADHFFTGKLDLMQAELAVWLKEQV